MTQASVQACLRGSRACWAAGQYVHSTLSGLEKFARRYRQPGTPWVNMAWLAGSTAQEAVTGRIQNQPWPGQGEAEEQAAPLLVAESAVGQPRQPLWMAAMAGTGYRSGPGETTATFAC